MASQGETSEQQPKISVFVCIHAKAPQPAAIPSSTTFLQPLAVKILHRCAHEVTSKDLRTEFTAGADGVLLYGCLVCDCDTTTDNLAVLRSIYRNNRTLKDLGLSPQRLREEWASRNCPESLQTAITEFATHLEKLGPANPRQTGSTPERRELEGRS